MKRIFILSLLILLLVNIVYAQYSESPTIKVTLLNYDPSPARAGDIVELRLRIENTGGGIAENLEVEILDD